MCPSFPSPSRQTCPPLTFPLSEKEGGKKFSPFLLLSVSLEVTDFPPPPPPPHETKKKGGERPKLWAANTRARKKPKNQDGLAGSVGTNQEKLSPTPNSPPLSYSPPPLPPHLGAGKLFFPSLPVSDSFLRCCVLYYCVWEWGENCFWVLLRLNYSHLCPRV